MSRVLGVDPGLSETGWALVEGGPGGPVRLLASGLIRTAAGRPLPERLALLHRQAADVLAAHAADSVAVEEMFFMRAADSVRGTLQARGVLLLAAAQAGLSVTPYNPRSVKLTLTGSGRAEKAQMQRAVQKTLGLPAPLRPDDVADAAAIALCHLRAQRLGRLRVLDRVGGRT